MNKPLAITAGVVVFFGAWVGLSYLMSHSGDANESQSGPYAGIAHMSKAMFGCQSLDTDHQITNLLAEHDESAAEDFIRANIATGECTELAAGDTVYVEDFKLTGLKEVRPQGSATSYWTMSEVVGP